MNEAQQIEESIPSAHYVDIILRRRWWLGLSAVAVWAGALALSLIMPSKYKSETLVMVEQDSVPVQIVTPNVTIDLQQRLRNLTEQILSRTQLARIAQEDRLYGDEPGRIVSESSVNQMRTDITIELIKPAGQADVSAFRIGYSALSPEMAQKVTSQLSSLFIQDSLDDQQKLSDDTSQLLESQFKAAHDELAQQDKILGDFKSKYMGELPEQMAGNVQILSGLQGRLGASTSALHQAEQQKLYLTSMLGTPRTQGDSGTLVTVTPLDEQIDKMKDDLATLSTHYTQRHPDVVQLKEQIASAEKARREGERNPKTGAIQSGSPSTRSERAISPRSQMEGQLKANELEIQNRKQEIRDLQGQISQYQARLNLTPLRQLQLVEVSRNHAQSQANYESLLAKKQQSGMATDMQTRRQGAQFRLIDPPSLPQKPYSPNRLRIAGLGFFLGLFLGLIAVALVETIDSRIYSEDDLKRWVSVPIIATVPPLSTPAEIKNQSWRHGVEIGFAALLVALVPALTFLAYLKS